MRVCRECVVCMINVFRLVSFCHYTKHIGVKYKSLMPCLNIRAQTHVHTHHVVNTLVHANTCSEVTRVGSVHTLAGGETEDECLPCDQWD